MRKSVKVGVASAGLLLIGAPAHANGDMTSFGNVGIANGIQAKVVGQVPVNFCGNALGILGSAAASCHNAHAKAGLDGHGHHGGDGFVGDMDTSLNVGIADGIQGAALVQVPINICGNAIGLLGDASANCRDASATANAFTHPVHARKPHVNKPYGAHRKLVADKKQPGATQPRPVAVPRKAPELGLIGDLLSPVTELLGMDDAAEGYGRRPHGTCHAGDMSTALNVGIADGIQAYAPIQVPVNFSGNALGLLGTASASASKTSATAKYC